MPGSSSNAPSRTPILSASSRSRLKRAEPHSPQNHFSAPSSGFQARRRPSPTRIRKLPGSRRALTDAAVPVRRWHRVQGQYCAETGGAVISKRTAPQPHPPVIRKVVAIARALSVRRHLREVAVRSDSPSLGHLGEMVVEVPAIGPLLARVLGASPLQRHAARVVADGADRVDVRRGQPQIRRKGSELGPLVLYGSSAHADLL